MRALLIAIALCIAGAVAAIAVGGSKLATFLAVALGGIAFVLVLAAVFYAAGRSEDRERAERAERARPGG